MRSSAMCDICGKECDSQASGCGSSWRRTCHWWLEVHRWVGGSLVRRASGRFTSLSQAAKLE